MHSGACCWWFFNQWDSSASKPTRACIMQWTKNGLCLWVSWVDDCLVVGTKEAVAIAKTQLMAKFDCDKIGNMDEYVGCKVDWDFDKDSLKLMQLVMLQSFVNKFPMCMDWCANYKSAIPGDHLVKGDDGTNIGGSMQAHYQARVGKLLHLMRWT
jgi:hypothetical protein